MIFGFNTDIKHAETVYHVQSEARKAEKLLQTQVFVRGRCIGKKATSFADLEKQPDFTEDKMHDMLKVQHRGMIDGIRAGKLNEMLGLDAEMTQPLTPQVVAAAVTAAPSAVAAPAPVAVAAPAPIATPAPAVAPVVTAAPAQVPVVAPVAIAVPAPAPAAAAPKGLAIEWTNADAVYAHSSVVMQLTITDNGAAVVGAQLTSRLTVASDPPIYSQAVTDASGKAEMKIFLDEKVLREATLLVQAKAGDRIATRKFILRKQA